MICVEFLDKVWEEREIREMIVICEMFGIICMILGINIVDWGLFLDGMLIGFKLISGNFRFICRSVVFICFCEFGNIKVFNFILFKIFVFFYLFYYRNWIRFFL